MRRRTWGLVLAGLVALLGVIWGALVVAGLSPGGEEGVTEPSGTRNVLRIEPVLSSVSCSDQKRTVLIFLDDLEARPSLTGSEANRGFAAFELTLHYDPKILQIEVPLDVRLNPGLSLEDPDGDGLARNFIPGPTTIDNFAGTVYMGAVGIGPGTEEGKREEGPDPVAKGAPLRLFSVEFLTVGEGTSPLTVSGAGVADSAVGQYTPLEIKESGITVSGGKCVEPLPATPRPTQVLPPAPPTATPPVVRPWQTVVPVPAAQGGRADCADGWDVYNDPDGRFSLCYPPGLRATTGPAIPGGRGAAVNLTTHAEDGAGTPVNSFLIAASWSPSKQILIGPESPVTCADMRLVSVQESIRSTDLVVAGRKATGCEAFGSELGPAGRFELRSIHVDIPVEPDGSGAAGFIGIILNYTGPDFEGTLNSALRILGTVAIHAVQSTGAPLAPSRTPAMGLSP
ncbi:MAG: hypothetical protein WBF66_02110 [Dehalococcoidia bacterium]